MKPLFNSWTDALIYSYLFSDQQYALSPLAKMMKQGIVGSGKGLVSLDGVAQAGLIKASVDRLPSLQRACILARYSPRFGECPCCGGDKPVTEYKEAIATLREWALSTFSGLSQRQMREAIVRCYFEPRVSISQVADELKISKRTAYDQKKKIFDALKALETEAQSHISALLERLFVEAA